MTRVFIVHHTHELSDGAEEVKLIGVFSSEAMAKQAVGSLSPKAGFAEFPEGFDISPYSVDQTHWQDGFELADE